MFFFFFFHYAANGRMQVDWRCAHCCDLKRNCLRCPQNFGKFLRLYCIPITVSIRLASASLLSRYELIKCQFLLSLFYYNNFINNWPPCFQAIIPPHNHVYVKKHNFVGHKMHQLCYAQHNFLTLTA